jgi:hypothetical protein
MPFSLSRRRAHGKILHTTCRREHLYYNFPLSLLCSRKLLQVRTSHALRVCIFRCDCPACVADSLEMRCGRNYNYFAELHSCSQPCAFSFVFLKSLAFSKLLYRLGLPKQSCYFTSQTKGPLTFIGRFRSTALRK